MKIRTENHEYIAELRVWRGGWNAGYDPDFLSDAEPAFFDGHYDYDSDSDTVIMTEAELKELCDWWEKEAEAASKDPDYTGDGLVGLTADEIETGDEYVFICEIC